MQDLILNAQKEFNKKFDNVTWFGRCIFLSWYCDVATCKFCFRSTIKHRIRHAKTAKRSRESILTDAIIGHKLGWRIEFLTGGYRMFPFEEILEITKQVSEIYGHKIWINLGALCRTELETLKPYIDGVCASIETMNPQLHNIICPDKPTEPYEKMLEEAAELGLKRSITIIIGLGETRTDYTYLKAMIKKYHLERITFYALKPVSGSGYTQSPEPEDYAWWIAKTRIDFPSIEIIAGLTPKNAEKYAGLILKAGANAVTKFPAIAKFGTPLAEEVERQIRNEREFQGTLTKLPDVDWNSEVDRLNLDNDLKDRIRKKLFQYVNKMKEQAHQNI